MFLFMIKVLNGHFMVTAINIDMVIDYVMVADVVVVRILVMVMFAIKVRGKGHGHGYGHGCRQVKGHCVQASTVQGHEER